jgi:uncharacterized membrane protein YgcG
MGDEVTREKYFSSGTAPAGDPLRENQKYRCQTCNQCEAVYVQNALNILYDTEGDLRQTFTLFSHVIAPNAGAVLWRQAWDSFECTKDECKQRKACGNRPTYFEIGAETAKGPAGRVRWRLYARLAREIQCVKEDPPPADVRPQIPIPPRPDPDLMPLPVPVPGSTPGGSGGGGGGGGGSGGGGSGSGGGGAGGSKPSGGKPAGGKQKKKGRATRRRR